MLICHTNFVWSAESLVCKINFWRVFFYLTSCQRILGLPDVFYKNTGSFVSSDKKSYHRKNNKIKA